MAKAKDIVCPVDKCKAAAGRPCKLVDLQRFPMLGKYHLVRIQTAEGRKEQDARTLLTSTNRIFAFNAK